SGAPAPESIQSKVSIGGGGMAAVAAASCKLARTSPCEESSLRECPADMCGIVGLTFNAGARASAVETVRCMNAAIVHRGPDDEGILAAERVVLGMRRLSIIDLAAGHQPIANEDETVWIICNGEI